MLLLSTNYIPVVVNHILMAFYTGKVPFNCKVIILSITIIINHIDKYICIVFHLCIPVVYFFFYSSGFVLLVVG